LELARREVEGANATAQAAQAAQVAQAAQAAAALASAKAAAASAAAPAASAPPPPVSVAPLAPPIPQPSVHAADPAEILRLEMALEEARAMVQLKSEYLSTMSQEIRAPMTGIMGMTNLLLESELDGEQRGMVEVIKSSSGALISLINDTLDFSRFDAGSLVIEHMGFDLRVTIEEVAYRLGPLAADKNLHFSCRVHHEVPSRLIGDPGRLRQVMLNLSACAIRNSDGGDVELRVERVEENDQAVSLRFSISDSCPGGTIEAVTRLYRCYGDDDLHHARRLGGAGLSLAVARQVVTRMGGFAGLEQHAKGNTLWFQVALDKQSEKATPGPKQDVQLRGLRALVVDASKASREAMVEMLSAWGCRVDALEHGEEALERLRSAAAQREPYRVALVDMQLQGLTGEDLGLAIRSDRTLAGTRTMLLTSLGRKGDAQRAQSLGFLAYLLKPLPWSELYEAMVEVVGRPEGAVGDSASLITRHSLAESRRGRVRVLLAEDNAVNQMVAQAALRRLGYAIDVVTDANAAIEASEKNRYDLILMDVQMADMDGCKAAAAIRAREHGRHVPIIGMSGRALEGDHARCLEAGMEDCLRKPIELERLCTTVEHWTRDKKGEDSSNARQSKRAGRVVITGSAAIPGAVAPLPVGAGLADDGTREGVTRELWTPNEAPPPMGSGQPSIKASPGASDGAGDAKWTTSAAAAKRIEQENSAVPLVPIDTGRLESSCMGIPALREALLQTFRADIGPRMMRLAEAVVAGDPRRVEFEAHGLKGMSATIGAVACEAAFEEIERLGRDEDLRTASRLLQIAQGTAERTEQFISRLERILSQANEAA
jgi:CheY-like chemotaxis protein/signal transduction histidine kinase